jgi:hypothetical protein
MKFTLPCVAQLIREIRLLSRKLDEAAELPIGRVEILELRPGDHIIFTHPRPLSVRTVERLRDQWRAYCEAIGKSGAPALVLDDGLAIQIVRPPNIEIIGAKEDVSDGEKTS